LVCTAYKLTQTDKIQIHFDCAFQLNQMGKNNEGTRIIPI
jgi:hypothetical protein